MHRDTQTRGHTTARTCTFTYLNSSLYVWYLRATVQIFINYKSPSPLTRPDHAVAMN